MPLARGTLLTIAIAAVLPASAAARVLPELKTRPLVSAPLATVKTVTKSATDLVPKLLQKPDAATLVGRTTTLVGQTVDQALKTVTTAAPLGTIVQSGTLLQPSMPSLLSAPPPIGSTAPASIALRSTPSGLLTAPLPGNAASLAEARRSRLRTLIRDNPAALEADELGDPVLRGRVVAVDATDAALADAARAGFSVLSDRREPALGIRETALAVPHGLSARAGLLRLEALVAGIVADYDHLFEPAGGALLPLAGALAAGHAGRGVSIGMVDGGVARHQALRGAAIEQQGFAGPARPSGHGTAVASLIVGNHRAFRGAAPGASLFVADVYGGRATSGSASAVARALGWLATKKPRVINISLVGPANKLVARSIAALRQRGIQVVAAVGNDGPAAPPQYPASNPGVVAVTGVDANGRALLESGRAAHLDFAAPGADMAAASGNGGFRKVRGTSFAAPLAAARLALVGSVPKLAAEARPGRGRVGRGIVCGTCRVDPAAVGLQ